MPKSRATVTTKSSKRSSRSRTARAAAPVVAIARVALAQGAASARVLNQGRLSGLLGYHLRLAHERVFREFAQVMRGSAMTAGRLGMLELIDANAGLSQSALARGVGLDRSSLVPVIDELEARGLVARSQGSDRRSHGLILTATGRRFIGRLRQRVRLHEQRIASGLTPVERAQLIALLGRLA